MPALLPNDVKDKAQRAREAIAALQAGPAPVEAPSTDSIPVPTTLTPAPTPAPVKAPEQASANEPARPDPSSPPREAQGNDDNADWKERYTLLRSSRDERREAVLRENAELKTRLQDTEQRIAAQQPPQPEQSSRFTLDEETRDSLGEDAKVIEQLGEHVDSRFDRYEQQQRDEQQRLTDGFFDDLSSEAPQWERLNNDAGFNNWLDSQDPEVGVVRRPSFSRLAKDRNVAAVARIINSYVRFESAGNAQPTPAPTNPVSPEPSTSRSVASDTSAPVEKTITANDVKDFYAEKNRLLRHGKLRGEMAEKVAAQEETIQRAMREGRVR